MNGTTYVNVRRSIRLPGGQIEFVEQELAFTDPELLLGRATVLARLGGVIDNVKNKADIRQDDVRLAGPVGRLP